MLIFNKQSNIRFHTSYYLVVWEFLNFLFKSKFCALLLFHTYYIIYILKVCILDELRIHTIQFKNYVAITTYNLHFYFVAKCFDFHFLYSLFLGRNRESYNIIWLKKMEINKTSFCFVLFDAYYSCCIAISILSSLNGYHNA